MFLKSIYALAAIATLGAAVPASAQGWGHQPGYYDNGQYQNVRYERGRRYNNDRRDYADRRYDRGRGNYRNQRCYDKGNGGLAIGAIAGGLLGNQIAGRGDRTLGTVLGAAGGGLAGRAIDKSDGRRC